LDGIHWEAMGHQKLAEAIAGQIWHYDFDTREAWFKIILKDDLTQFN
jgi:hypothetical protein